MRKRVWKWFAGRGIPSLTVGVVALPPEIVSKAFGKSIFVAAVVMRNSLARNQIIVCVAKAMKKLRFAAVGYLIQVDWIVVKGKGRCSNVLPRPVGMTHKAQDFPVTNKRQHKNVVMMDVVDAIEVMGGFIEPSLLRFESRVQVLRRAGY